MVGTLNRVVFRADASIQMGTGHVMRCLTLADALAVHGVASHFLMRPLPGHLIDIVTARGHGVTALSEPEPESEQSDGDDLYQTWLGVPRLHDAAECAPFIAGQKPDLVVMDHYALGRDWVQAAVPDGTRVLAIDDLAARPHACDLLLDQNLGRRPADYDGLVPEGACRLTGPRFALLRPDFAAARPVALARRAAGEFGHVVIAMGGMDKDDATGQVLAVLGRLTLPPETRITVVLGRAAPHLAALRDGAAAMPYPTEIRPEVRDMAGLMAEADLSIGGAGSTAWERCCLALPTLMLTIADNQVPAARALDAVQGALYQGDIRTGDWQEPLSRTMMRFATDADWRHCLSQTAAAVCDGEGTGRTVAAIRETIARKPIRIAAV